ncbi:MAG TPA: DUF1127 domain-containing protein [Hyphomicrobiaceae bacterium]|nr:DUF1127 domain-containing protein [Hyphomicrobiaceae bacterium]
MMISKSLQLASLRTDALDGAVQGSDSAPSVLKGALLAAPARLLRRLLEQRKYQRAVQELRGLDDRMLRDIGVDRAAIPYAARFGRETF